MKLPSIALGLAVSCASSAVFAQSYRFDIDPERSYTDGYLQIKYWTSGTFKGDFDAEKSPTGTRTLLGADGPTGDTTNDAVSASPVWDFFRTAVFRTDGFFDLSVDLASGKATVENYRVERLADGPTNVSGRMELNNEPFRTLVPPATLANAIPIFSQGTMVLDRLRISQRPGPRTGTVTPMEDGWYRVSVTFMADVLIDVLELGQSKPLEFLMAASLVGDFRKTGDGAEFAYVRGQGGDNLTRDVNINLEEYPCLILVDKEQRARVKVQSTIKRVSLQINGIRQFGAVGELRPEPQKATEIPPCTR